MLSKSQLLEFNKGRILKQQNNIILQQKEQANRLRTMKLKDLKAH